MDAALCFARAIFSAANRRAAHYRAAPNPVNRTDCLLSVCAARRRLTPCGRALNFAQSLPARERIAQDGLCPARYQRNPPGMEGRESRAAVGEREGASPGASAGTRSSLVVAKDPAAALRRDRHRLAGRGGAARAAARRAQTPRRAAHLEDVGGQYSNSLAGRKGAPTPAYY